MGSPLILLRNEGDVQRAKALIGTSPATLVAFNIAYSDFKGERVLFSQVGKKIEAEAKKRLKGSKLRFVLADYDLAGLPAEKLSDLAEKLSCDEIIVFADRFQRDLPYANNLAATLAVTSNVPIRVVKT